MSVMHKNAASSCVPLFSLCVDEEFALGILELYVIKYCRENEIGETTVFCLKGSVSLSQIHCF